jgi:hypothetical protein
MVTPVCCACCVSSCHVFCSFAALVCARIDACLVLQALRVWSLLKSACPVRSAPAAPCRRRAHPQRMLTIALPVPYLCAHSLKALGALLLRQGHVPRCHHRARTHTDQKGDSELIRSEVFQCFCVFGVHFAQAPKKWPFGVNKKCSEWRETARFFAPLPSEFGNAKQVRPNWDSDFRLPPASPASSTCRRHFARAAPLTRSPAANARAPGWRHAKDAA